MVADGAVPVLQIRSVGGAVNDIDPDATAYAHRTQNFSLNVVLSTSRRAAAERTWQRLDVAAIYLSFESYPDDALLAKAFPPRTLSIGCGGSRAVVDDRATSSGTTP